MSCALDIWLQIILLFEATLMYPNGSPEIILYNVVAWIRDIFRHYLTKYCIEFLATNLSGPLVICTKPMHKGLIWITYEEVEWNDEQWEQCPSMPIK